MTIENGAAVASKRSRSFRKSMVVCALAFTMASAMAETSRSLHYGRPEDTLYNDIKFADLVSEYVKAFRDAGFILEEIIKVPNVVLGKDAVSRNLNMVLRFSGSAQPDGPAGIIVVQFYSSYGDDTPCYRCSVSSGQFNPEKNTSINTNGPLMSAMFQAFGNASSKAEANLHRYRTANLLIPLRP